MPKRNRQAIAKDNLDKITHAAFRIDELSRKIYHAQVDHNEMAVAGKNPENMFFKSAKEMRELLEKTATLVANAAEELEVYARPYGIEEEARP
jgi:hypothetical protein